MIDGEWKSERESMTLKCSKWHNDTHLDGWSCARIFVSYSYLSERLLTLPIPITRRYGYVEGSWRKLLYICMSDSLLFSSSSSVSVVPVLSSDDHDDDGKSCTFFLPRAADTSWSWIILSLLSCFEMDKSESQAHRHFWSWTLEPSLSLITLIYAEDEMNLCAWRWYTTKNNDKLITIRSHKATSHSTCRRMLIDGTMVISIWLY